MGSRPSMAEISTGQLVQINAFPETAQGLPLVWASPTTVPNLIPCTALRASVGDTPVVCALRAPADGDWSISARSGISLHTGGAPGPRKAAHSPRASPSGRRARPAIDSNLRSAPGRRNCGR
eukprot:2944651-Alexandrium_andersonii.AAC.1